MRNPFHRHKSAEETQDGWNIIQVCGCGAIRARNAADPDGWNEWWNHANWMKKIK